jgi:hypothetical protein
MVIGKMLSGLTSLTQLSLPLHYIMQLSDRSIGVISESICKMKSLTHLNLNLSYCSGKE